MAAPVEYEQPEAAARVQVPLALDPDDPDAELDTTDIDVELLDIFLEESGDLLDHSDGLLADLRDKTNDRELVVGLQRDLHTLKGGARMAGIFAIGELGHAMESLLEVVAEGRRELDQTGVVVLERAFDRLHGMVTRVGERKAIVLPANLIGQINALAKGRPLAEVDLSTPAAEITELTTTHHHHGARPQGRRRGRSRRRPPGAGGPCRGRQRTGAAVGADRRPGRRRRRQRRSRAAGTGAHPRRPARPPGQLRR